MRGIEFNRIGKLLAPNSANEPQAVAYSAKRAISTNLPPSLPRMGGERESLPASLEAWWLLAAERAAARSSADELTVTIRLAAGSGGTDNGTVFLCNFTDDPRVKSGVAKTATEEDRELFARLASEWLGGRGHGSSIAKMAMHDAYQRIIGMGSRAVPLILGELARTPEHWTWALRAITGENPVPAESRGKLREMAAAWLRWGHQQGYRW